MHRRTAAPTSSKVAASRERRAARLRNNGAGSIAIPYNGHKHVDTSGALRKKLIIAGGTLTVGILSGLWIAALYHVTSTADDGSSSHGKLSMSGPINTSLRQIKNKKKDSSAIISSSSAMDYSNIYTPEAIQQNPYLGWQPQR